MKIQITKEYIKVIFAFLIIGSAFYWFEIRPAGIRTYCEKYVHDLFGFSEDPMDISLILENRGEAPNFVYEFCLHKKGI